MADPAAGGVERFAAAVVHDIRTPVSALSGEVDLARRRERTTLEYRDILSRIADRVAELIDLTDNLALLGNPAAAREKAAHVASLDAALATVAGRCAGVVDVDPPGAATAQIVGDEGLVTRALRLLVEYAQRHRRGDGRVRLRVAAADTGNVPPGFTELIVDAAPAGFWPGVWRHLDAGTNPPAPPAPPDPPDAPAATAPVRLRTAMLIMDACGGSVRCVQEESGESVRVRFRNAGAAR